MVDDGDQEGAKIQAGALLDLGANGIGCKCDIPQSVMCNMDLLLCSLTASTPNQHALV